MKILKLAVAAAIAVTGLTISAAPAAAAQRGDRMERRDNAREIRQDRRELRQDRRELRRDRRDARRDRRDDRRDWRRHYNRGHHYGWRNHPRHRVCRTVWRHHMRQRVCWWRR